MVVNWAFDLPTAARLALNENIVSAAEVSHETGGADQPVSVSGKTRDNPLDPGDGRLYRHDRRRPTAVEP